MPMVAASRDDANAPKVRPMTTLDLLRPGSHATVVGFDASRCADAVLCRLRELGFREGEQIEVVRRAPMGDPMVFRVCDYELCLRRRDAGAIRVDVL